MQIFSKNYDYNPTSVEFQFFDENSLLFDIETTGLSKKNHQIYLIGCAHRSAEKITIHQFFAESPAEEADIILEFLQLAGKYKKLITFNGKRFDIPFVLEKCSYYHFDSHLLPPDHLDIYLECKKIKALLGLNSCKQTSVEAFLGIQRKDLYDGGQLIQVYKDYVISKSSEALDLLLLHNYEDVAKMVEILPILSYHEMLHIPLEVTSFEIKEYTDLSGVAQQELSFHAKIPVTLPVAIHIHRPYVHLFLKEDNLHGTILLYQGTLNHYLPNYKEYVYLPKEDMVVLKSMASCISTCEKEKATAENCCIHKDGFFIPLPDHIQLSDDIYLFYDSPKSGSPFMLYDTETVDASFLEQYLFCFLQNLS